MDDERGKDSGRDDHAAQAPSSPDDLDSKKTAEEFADDPTTASSNKDKRSTSSSRKSGKRKSTNDDQDNVGDQEGKKRARPSGRGEKDSGSRSQTKKKPKEQRPGDMPKRPLSAYNFFFREVRSSMIEEETKLPEEQLPSDPSSLAAPAGNRKSFEDMTKSIGQRWKSLSAEEMAKYKAMAAEDLKRYRDEMEQYQARMAMKARAEREQAAREREIARKLAASRESSSTTNEASTSQHSNESVWSSQQIPSATGTFQSQFAQQQVTATQPDPLAPFGQNPVDPLIFALLAGQSGGDLLSLISSASQASSSTVSSAHHQSQPYLPPLLPQDPVPPAPAPSSSQDTQQLLQLIITVFAPLLATSQQAPQAVAAPQPPPVPAAQDPNLATGVLQLLLNQLQASQDTQQDSSNGAQNQHDDSQGQGGSS